MKRGFIVDINEAEEAYNSYMESKREEIIEILEDILEANIGIVGITTRLREAIEKIKKLK